MAFLVWIMVTYPGSTRRLFQWAVFVVLLFTSLGGLPSGEAQANHAPVLSNGKVSPSNGPQDTTFDFTVTYTDSDGHPPGGGIRVVIDGSSYDMSPTDNYDTNYKDGKGYSFKTQYQSQKLSPGNHNYYFTASDGELSARHPASGSLSGPTVQQGCTTNGTPTFNLVAGDRQIAVSWSPPGGDSCSIDSFVIWWDKQGQTTGNNYYQASSTSRSYTITGLTNEQTYQVQMKAVFQTNSGTTSGPESSKKYGTPQSGNHAPVLSSGSVSPTSGPQDTTFDFTVTYTDSDGHPPGGGIRVVIDGSSYDMSPTDNYDTNYKDGKGYSFKTQYQSQKLSPGNHNYYFTASDGELGARLPASGSLSGPTVQQGCTTNGTPTFSLAPGDQQITVSWSPPGGDSCPIDSYVIWWDKQGQTTGNNHQQASSATRSYTITGLTNGQSYEVWMKAVFQTNGGPTSGPESSKKYVTPQSGNHAPLLSSGGVSPASGPQDTTFEFTVIYTDSDGHPPGGGVRVVVDGNPYDMSPTNSYDSNYKDGKTYAFKTQYQSQKLSPGNHNYYFTASDGELGARLPASGSLSGPTVQQGCTTNGTPTFSLAPGDQQITVSWSPPGGDSCPIDSYVIWWDKQGQTAGNNHQQASSATRSYTITGLTNGQSYEVWMKAVFQTNGGPTSGPETPKNTAAPRPGCTRDTHPVFELTGADRAIRVTWRPPAPEECSYDGVEVTWSPAASGSGSDQHGAPATPTSYTISGLQNGITYEVSIRAIYGMGDTIDFGPPSPSRSAIPQDENLPPFVYSTNPAADQAITLLAGTARLLTATFQDENDDERWIEQVRWYINGNRVTDADYTCPTGCWQIESNHEVRFAVVGEHVVQVTATDKRGLSATAQWKIQVVSDNGAPKPVKNLRGEYNTVGFINLAWETDQSGGAPTSFELFRGVDGAAATLYHTLDARVHGLRDDKVQPGHAYTYKIVAVNEDGRADSETIPVTTGSTPPGIPRLVAVGPAVADYGTSISFSLDFSNPFDHPIKPQPPTIKWSISEVQSTETESLASAFHIALRAAGKIGDVWHLQQGEAQVQIPDSSLAPGEVVTGRLTLRIPALIEVPHALIDGHAMPAAPGYFANRLYVSDVGEVTSGASRPIEWTIRGVSNAYLPACTLAIVSSVAGGKLGEMNPIGGEELSSQLHQGSLDAFGDWVTTLFRDPEVRASTSTTINDLAFRDARTMWLQLHLISTWTSFVTGLGGADEEDVAEAFLDYAKQSAHAAGIRSEADRNQFVAWALHTGAGFFMGCTSALLAEGMMLVAKEPVSLSAWKITDRFMARLALQSFLYMIKIESPMDVVIMNLQGSTASVSNDGFQSDIPAAVGMVDGTRKWLAAPRWEVASVVWAGTGSGATKVTRTEEGRQVVWNIDTQPGMTARADGDEITAEKLQFTTQQGEVVIVDGKSSTFTDGSPSGLRDTPGPPSIIVLVLLAVLAIVLGSTQRRR